MSIRNRLPARSSCGAVPGFKQASHQQPLTSTAMNLDASSRQRCWPEAASGSFDRIDLLCACGLFIVCLVMFFWGLGSYGIIDPGDGYFCEGAREMIELGDYVRPHLNYQVYFSKPVLIYWLIASAYHVFGISEFAARFWPAALSTGLAQSIYWLGRCAFSRKTGLLAGIVFASSPLVVTFARLSLVDAPLTCFVGLAVVAFVMTTVLGSRRWWPVFYIAMGLSMLTKGPVAIVLLAGAFALFLFVRRPSLTTIRQWLARLHIIPGSLIFVALVAPWHLAVARATDGLFLTVFYLYENVARFQGHVNHEHPELWYYLGVLAYGFFPWVVFLPPALANVFKARRFSGDLGRSGADTLVFLACFVLVVLGFFAVSAAKVQTYILPAFPALSLLVAAVLDRWLRNAVAPRWLTAATAGLAALALCAAAGAPVLAFFLQGLTVWAGWNAVLAGLLIGVGWTGSFLCLRRRRTAVALCLFVATTVAGCALTSRAAFEVGYRLRNASLHALIRPLQGQPGQVAFYQEFKPSVMFYLERPVDTFFSPDQLEATGTRTRENSPGGAAGTPLYILAGKAGISSLLAVHGRRLKLIDRKGPWHLFLAEGLAVRKLPTLEEAFRKRMQMSSGQFTWGALPFAGGSARPRLSGSE